MFNNLEEEIQAKKEELLKKMEENKNHVLDLPEWNIDSNCMLIIKGNKGIVPFSSIVALGVEDSDKPNQFGVCKWINVHIKYLTKHLVVCPKPKEGRTYDEELEVFSNRLFKAYARYTRIKAFGEKHE